jgi:hypothetical protein
VKMNEYVNRWLPPVRILHPFPNVRFAAKAGAQCGSPRSLGSVRGAARKGGPYCDARLNPGTSLHG